jgi:DNA end-binding protein Ku
MPRAIWKGSIGFGLVNVPVSMYAAVSEQDLHFHMIHTKDHARIGYEKVCKDEGKAVPSKEIARAYELDDGSLVVMDDEDFEAARAEGYHAITVQDFVPYDAIDPIYFERTYFLGPQDEDGPAAHTYELLARAMEDAGLAAVCTYIFHQRENLGCLRVRDGVLHLEKMYFGDEVRDPDDVRPRTKDKPAKRELEMARQLIDRMAAKRFEPERYKDTYREALLTIIKRKAKGEKITARPKEEAPVTDLLAALEASLEAAQGKGGSNGRGGSANGSRKGPGKGSGKDGDLADRSLGELRDQAAEQGIKGRSKMSKDELVEALS